MIRGFARSTFRAAALAAAVALAAPAALAHGAGATVRLLNVSYDPTRELLKEIGEAFAAAEKEATGADVVIKQSHGGSGAQARAVIDGLEADVVTLALEPDVDAIRKAGLVAANWRERLPNRAVPWTSTIVFVVRKGNPKGIADWPDLVKPGIEIVTPNPKTSGNGKLSFLAAWGSVLARGGSEEEARAFVTKIYRRTPVLDSGARGSTTTFARKGIGDVHLTWENEAHLELEESGGALEIVHPRTSILAEPPVAVVDANVKRRGTDATARRYLEFLYTPRAQEIVARHFYRPVDPQVREKHAASFPELELFPVTAVAKDWDDAFRKFFADGAVFDVIYETGR